MNKQKEYYSVTELAKKMKISRIAVHKQIKKGRIKAHKIGKNYAIPVVEADYLLKEKPAKKPLNKGEIVIYKEGKDGEALDVKLRNDTV